MTRPAFPSAAVADQPAPSAVAYHDGHSSRHVKDTQPIAVIDIGSNSVRLVVYNGLARTPSVLFNEKIMAGLGTGIISGGNLPAEAMDCAHQALTRFRLLCDAMGVETIRAVATAAVREAANGAAFVADVAARTGIAVEIISGETEGTGAAMGVIAGIPDAEGVVGDLGGGSLELARISAGEVVDRTSLPLGALRLSAQMEKGRRALASHIDKHLATVSWADHGADLPFHAVGGSWRALAHLHMHVTGWPLPVAHQYFMPATAPDRLVHSLAHMSEKTLKNVPNVSSARAAHLPGVTMLQRAIVRRFRSSSIIVSAFGLREGLLYQTLADSVRRQDPLLGAAREMARRLGRSSSTGDPVTTGEALLRFIDPLFAGESPTEKRLRHATALLSGSSWRAHPDLRAEDGMTLALHGRWAAIDAHGRAMLAAALWAVNGGSWQAPATAILSELAPVDALLRAHGWGLALRLGQRLAGGTADLLTHAGLARTKDQLVLTLPAHLAPLYVEPIARRHQALARIAGLVPHFAVS